MRRRAQCGSKHNAGAPARPAESAEGAGAARRGAALLRASVRHASPRRSPSADDARAAGDDGPAIVRCRRFRRSGTSTSEAHECCAQLGADRAWQDSVQMILMKQVRVASRLLIQHLLYPMLQLATQRRGRLLTVLFALPCTTVQSEVWMCPNRESISNGADLCSVCYQRQLFLADSERCRCYDSTQRSKRELDHHVKIAHPARIFFAWRPGIR